MDGINRPKNLFLTGHSKKVASLHYRGAPRCISQHLNLGFWGSSTVRHEFPLFIILIAAASLTEIGEEPVYFTLICVYWV